MRNTKNIVSLSFAALALLITLALAPSPAPAADAQPLTLRVDAAKPGPAISPTMYGIFFEDINFAGDGGMYPELISNRSFEFREPMLDWKWELRGGAFGSLRLMDNGGLNPNNPHYLRIQVETAGGGYGVTNEGFRGVGVEKGKTYDFSLYARSVDGKPVAVQALVEGATGGKAYGSAKVEGFTKEWKKFSAPVTVSATDAKARFVLLVQGLGTLDVDMISLFPRETFQQRPGGLRADLAQKLKELKPGFMRFPGGCIVEGNQLDNRYRWKETIGDLAERKLNWNRWNDWGKVPDYYQSYGLGFYEFFQLCEDIGAEPLPIVNCGMSCQFEGKELVPLDQLGPYIQDMLDLIEFANGPATSTWGAKRAAMGHPAPFNMKMLGVGNEQWSEQYFKRYAIFYKELKAKHPEIKLVTGSGPDPSGDKFDFAWSYFKKNPTDLVDEHFYRPPQWFFDNAHRYDTYDRNGAKVFAGEYAAHTGGTGAVNAQGPGTARRNTLEAALAEAAFLTHVERNADVVQMASYAPLLANIEVTQWAPDLIWFDHFHSFGTPSYYVQQLFSVNKGTRVLPLTIEGQKEGRGSALREILYAVASRDEKSGDLILKVVNPSKARKEARIALSGVEGVKPRGEATVLASKSLTDQNSLENPKKVAPVTKPVEGAGSSFRFTFDPYSMTVLRLKTK